ncbi:cyanobactin biosynthesis system PatB/AcyB/McaB family protein [Bradyrhizobium pachyrhizi]|uniref:cyanobactin biosynthesis system PatB/AcyB/McaB family protein n=1 Tax=Bradyrhizobium pachyrhizi TaxID=280333 RepID=UPI003D3651C7
MALPRLTRPIKRSARPLTGPDVIDPSTCVNLTDGDLEDIKVMWVHVVFGANYNDPASYRNPGYRQIMSSGISRRSF